jgi:hypothetical protein
MAQRNKTAFPPDTSLIVASARGRFLDKPLTLATVAALNMRCEEVKIISRVLTEVHNARKRFGKEHRWLSTLDWVGLRQHLEDTMADLNSEQDLLNMLTTSDSGATKVRRGRPLAEE